MCLFAVCILSFGFSFGVATIIGVSSSGWWFMNIRHVKNTKRMFDSIRDIVIIRAYFIRIIIVKTGNPHSPNCLARLECATTADTSYYAHPLLRKCNFVYNQMSLCINALAIGLFITFIIISFIYTFPQSILALWQLQTSLLGKSILPTVIVLKIKSTVRQKRGLQFEGATFARWIFHTTCWRGEKPFETRAFYYINFIYWINHRISLRLFEKLHFFFNYFL